MDTYRPVWHLMQQKIVSWIDSLDNQVNCTTNWLNKNFDMNTKNDKILIVFAQYTSS